MELLNRKFYGEAAEAFAGKREAEPVLPLTRKQKEELAGLLELLHRAETAPPLEPDPERMAWFRELVPRVKRFADLFVLDVVMSVDERAQGLIQLEGVVFDLSLSESPDLRSLWALLCRSGSLSINHFSEVFQIQFSFDLRGQ